MPVNSDAMTRAELRRTRLDLIRQEYEVNRISRAHSMNFLVFLFEKIKSTYEAVPKQPQKHVICIPLSKRTVDWF